MISWLSDALAQVVHPARLWEGTYPLGNWVLEAQQRGLSRGFPPARGTEPHSWLLGDCGGRRKAEEKAFCTKLACQQPSGCGLWGLGPALRHAGPPNGTAAYHSVEIPGYPFHSRAMCSSPAAHLCPPSMQGGAQLPEAGYEGSIEMLLGAQRR